jgi:hypothetical protein
MIVAGCHPFGVARSQRHVGRDEHGGADPVRMPRGEGERPGTTLGRAQDRGALDAAGVQDLRGIFSEEQISVEIWIQGTVRTTVAQPVEHDHAIPGAKVSHLVAPEVAVDDRPGRQKQHRLVCVTELLPVDPLTRTRHIARLGGLDADDHLRPDFLPAGSTAASAARSPLSEHVHQ